jgi:hypothetical protein
MLRSLDVQGISMLFAPQKELTEEYLFTDSNFWEEVEQLEKEKDLLNEKIEELMMAEQQLLIRISNAFLLKRQLNEELKEKVKLLERNCEELDKFLQSLTIFAEQ